jgi:hypothetical protein
VKKPGFLRYLHPESPSFPMNQPSEAGLFRQTVLLHRGTTPFEKSGEVAIMAGFDKPARIQLRFNLQVAELAKVQIFPKFHDFGYARIGADTLADLGKVGGP